MGKRPLPASWYGQNRPLRFEPAPACLGCREKDDKKGYRAHPIGGRWMSHGEEITWIWTGVICMGAQAQGRRLREPIWITPEDMQTRVACDGTLWSFISGIEGAEPGVLAA